MKTHYCKADKTVISYEGECSWCGEKENGVKEEALKLAEIFEEVGRAKYPYHLDAAEMLRKLVEELDEKNYRILELTKRYKALTWNDKQGEPVVYWDGKHFASKEKSSLADIPLYTTPQTKPLSDEEYEKIMQQWDYWRKQIADGNTSSAPRDWFESIIDF